MLKNTNYLFKMLHFAKIFPISLLVACAHPHGSTNVSEPVGNWRMMPERHYGGVIIFSSSKSIGHGFRNVDVSVTTKSKFEGLAHYSHLYYRKQFLSDNRNFSISPSGHYAVYHNGETMELFDSCRNAIVTIAQGFSTPTQFNWSPNEVILTLDDSYSGKRITISTESGEQFPKH